jgi:hypothetical protein
MPMSRGISPVAPGKIDSVAIVIAGIEEVVTVVVKVGVAMVGEARIVVVKIGVAMAGEAAIVVVVIKAVAKLRTTKIHSEDLSKQYQANHGERGERAESRSTMKDTSFFNFRFESRHDLTGLNFSFFFSFFLL